MTDNTVKPVQTEEASEAIVSANAESTKANATVQKSGGKGLSVFAILLSLTALGAGGYNWYDANINGKLDEASVAVDVAAIGGQVSRIGDTVTSLQAQQNNVVTQEQLVSRLLEANSATDLRFRDIGQSQQTLFTAVEKINSGLERGVNQFVIDEVSQLLKLANNTILFSGNVESARNALKLADLQLKELSDPRYSVVRKKINEEIGALNALEQVDVESLSVQLKSLSNRIPSLKLENDTPILGDADLALEVDDQTTGIKQTAKKMLNDLIDLVHVQKIDKAPKPLLAPEQRYFLDQNIQLQLTKAELSIVQNRAAMYADSLNQVTTMLSDYFDANDAAVQDVQAKLNELKNVKLGQDLPSIVGSYTLLQSIKGGE